MPALRQRHTVLSGGGFVPANATSLDRRLRVACVGDVSNLRWFLMPRWDYARDSYGLYSRFSCVPWNPYKNGSKSGIEYMKCQGPAHQLGSRKYALFTMYYLYFDDQNK